MKARALVAQNLRRLRIRRALSQKNLAVDADVDRSYVSRLERGLENPTVAKRERLADALGSNTADFFIAPTAGELSPKPLRARGREDDDGRAVLDVEPAELLRLPRKRPERAV